MIIKELRRQRAKKQELRRRRALKERDLEFTFDPLKRCCLHTSYFKHLSASQLAATLCAEETE